MEKIIDALGQIKKQIEVLKKEQTELEQTLKEKMNIGVSITGKQYSAKLSEKINIIFDPQKVQKTIKDNKKFLEVISIKNMKIGHYLSKEQMDNCIAELKKSTMLTIKAIKKGE